MLYPSESGVLLTGNSPASEHVERQRGVKEVGCMYSRTGFIFNI